MSRRARAALSLSVPSDLAEIDAACAAAAELLRARGQDGQVFAATLLLREFMNNAVLHGNRSDKGKKVALLVRIGREWITIKVSDEGPGFDWRARRRAVPDENAVSGRGLAIGAAYSERMHYNRTGNQVTLRLRMTLGRR